MAKKASVHAEVSIPLPLGGGSSTPRPLREGQGEGLLVYGARVHNLKNVDVTLPRYALNVITGLSGSGKSSLAFDTIYAEGQRRYIETFSAYARNFLDHLERPDVDKITGLSPVISIEQKTTNKNPRSTVGTVTEIYDFLRLLFARAADAYSYETGERMGKFTETQIVEMILSEYADRRIYLLAPLVRSRKGHYRELFENTRKKGYLHVRVDGDIREIIPGMRVDRYKNHDIEVVVDRLCVQQKDEERLCKSVAKSLELGEGLLLVCNADDSSVRYFSRSLMDPVSGISYREPAPHNFSFNSVQGACPKCKGLGYVVEIDREKVCPDPSKSIAEGAFLPLGKYRDLNIFARIKDVLKQYDCTLDTPVDELPDEAVDELINGSADDYIGYQGLAVYIQQLADVEQTAAAKKWADQFNTVQECPCCHGARLNREALSYRFADKNIHELSCMDLQELYDWTDEAPARCSGKQATIAAEILKEIRSRLRFLLDVGLDYMSLSRSMNTLSGGESQRIKLAYFLSMSGESGRSPREKIMFIFDEPTTGLHFHDVEKLLKAFDVLLAKGHSLVVVEHNPDVIRSADWIIDLGPDAGENGGRVVFAGTPEELKDADTFTARYI